MPGLMDGTSYFPSRPEMERNIASFVERTGTRIRYDCPWTATRREDGPDGERFILETPTANTAPASAIFAVGVAEPNSPSTPGIELAHHYSDIRPAETYAGRRVFLIGKSVSAFELATGLLRGPASSSSSRRRRSSCRSTRDPSWASGPATSSPTRTMSWAAGCPSWTPRSSRSSGARATRSSSARSDPPAAGELAIDTDDVINATGFICPLLDLPGIGVSVFGQSQAARPDAVLGERLGAGDLLRGDDRAGVGRPEEARHAGELRGGPWRSVQRPGAGRHVARTVFGRRPDRPAIAADELVSTILGELSSAPELWHQRAYLARVISLDGGDGLRDEGIVPLAAFVDGIGDDGTGDALALTLEADGTRRDLPGDLPPPRGQGRGAGDRVGPAAALRHARDPARVAEIVEEARSAAAAR